MALRSGNRSAVARCSWGRLALLWAALAVIAPASQAHAQNRITLEAKRAYERGWKALQAGNFGEAYENYKRSYDLEPRPRTLFNIAVTEEKLGRYEDAMRHYEQFIDEAEPRDAEFKRQAVEKYAALEARVMGRIRVTSKPAGADVFVDEDSSPRGKTPLTIVLAAGEHTVRVAPAGTEASEREVMVVAGRTVRARFAFDADVPVAITAVPADAQIRRKGDDTPVRGAYRKELRPGGYDFVVSRDGYEEQSFTVIVKPGRIYEREVVLREVGGTGVIVVTSNMAGATVSVDGVVVGTTSHGDPTGETRPLLRHEAAWGEHTLFVEGDGRRAWRKKLHVSPNEIVAVDVDFHSSSGKRRLARWSLAGIGAAGLITGGTLGVLAIQDVTEPVDDNHGRGKTRALLSDALIIGGAAALVGAWKLGDAPQTKAAIRRSHAEK